jgi:hypothetical protein
MKSKLKKVINHPLKAARYLKIAITHHLTKKKGLLVIVGLDPNGEFDILAPGYEQCIGFEANPERYKALVRKHGNKKNVSLYNYAVTNYIILPNN